jgi:hypothetical protein
MKWIMIAVGVFAGLAAMALGMNSRKRDDAPTDEERQWPFDRQELRSLMSRVTAEQRSRVEQLEPGPMRDRATAFLRYYERRHAAVQ